MNERDAGQIMFESYLRDGDFMGGGTSVPSDPVLLFFKAASFAVASGCNMEKLTAECASNDYRFTNFLAKGRLKIQLAKVTESAGDAPLAKGELVSRMYSLLDELRADATADEVSRMEKAACALDIPAFTQIAQGVISRIKKAKAA